MGAECSGAKPVPEGPAGPARGGAAAVVTDGREFKFRISTGDALLS